MVSYFGPDCGACPFGLPLRCATSSRHLGTCFLFTQVIRSVFFVALLAEITSIRQEDVHLGNGAHVRCEGKGRKERCTPLTKPTVVALKAWIREQGAKATNVLFPSSRGDRLSADAVQYMVAKYAKAAGKKCPSMTRKRVSPHVLRHTTAMELLQGGVDKTLIALWLGHESTETTQMYLDANLRMKEEALSKVAPIKTKLGRYQPDDDLLAFLKSL